MEEERINVSQRERDRLRVLHALEEGHLQQREAARRLRLSERQILDWRIISRRKDKYKCCEKLTPPRVTTRMVKSSPASTNEQISG